jgi:hypothetical protein
VESVTQQKSGELLAGLPQAASRGQACANQIAHCLMGKVGNPYGRQFAGPMQLRQIDGVRRSVLMRSPGLREIRLKSLKVVLCKSKRVPGVGFSPLVRIECENADQACHWRRTPPFSGA